MNERIKELIEKATVRREEYLPGNDGHPTPTSYFDKEKFAELIIKECVKLQHRNVIVGGGASVYNMGRRDLAEDILKHFGVES
jgi:hypothetical protein